MNQRLTYIIIFLSFNGFCQQDPLTTQFWNNLAHFNPAYTGLEYVHSGAVTFRNQWTGLEGAPMSLFANYGTRIADHHGLGINYELDQIAFSRTNELNINYNYQFDLNKSKRLHTYKRLSLGAGIGIYNLQMNPSWIPPTTDFDATLPSAFNKTAPNLNLGLAYSTPSWALGVGAKHVIPQRFTDGSFSYTVATHLYTNGRLSLRVNRKFDLILRGIMRTDFVKVSGDINLEAHVKNYVWIIAGYRTSKAVQLGLGSDIKSRYRIGYSIDLYFGSFNSNPSHEIVVGYYLK